MTGEEKCLTLLCSLFMKKRHLIPTFIFAPALLAGATVFFSSQTSVLADNAETIAPLASAEARLPETETIATPTPETLPPFTWPMDNAQERVTKKPFGLLIQAGHSPVENDRFTGYHVGVDFETFEDEQEIDVPIYAICDGRLVFKTFANGYGGVALQECDLYSEPVTVIYGHLNLESIDAEAEEFLNQGGQIGILGKGFSEETDGVRKHLHLGIHTGSEIDIRGYVQKEEETTRWLDVLSYLPQ